MRAISFRSRSLVHTSVSRERTSGRSIIADLFHELRRVPRTAYTDRGRYTSRCKRWASRGWKGFAEEETREEVAAKSSWTMFDSLLVRRGSKRSVSITFDRPSTMARIVGLKRKMRSLDSSERSGEEDGVPRDTGNDNE